MKIKKIKIFNIMAGWKPWSFLKIETNNGYVGWSETTDTFGNQNGYEGILKDYKQLLIGEDPREINKLIWKLETKTKSNPGSLVQRIIAGIENALWDINGKYYNLPVYQMFGGKLRNEARVYWSHCGTTRIRNAKEARKPEIKNLNDIKKFGKEIVKSGFNVLKTNIAIFDKKNFIYMPGHKHEFKNPSLTMSDKVYDGIDFWISNLQKSVNKKVAIALDLNFNFKPVDLIKICKKLSSYNLKWLEIDVLNAKTLLDIKKFTNIPIVSGETLSNIISYKSFFELRALDYASVDTAWIGFGVSKKVADLANLYDINITTHNYNGYLGSFINTHLAAVVPNFFIGEVDYDEPPGIEKIFSHKPIIRNSYIKVEDRPGWGCDIIEENLFRLK
jgi:L-alanine-DL-glutamate epimerase-like enolase superfamily enzyme